MIKFLLSYDGRKPTERRQSRQNAYEHFERGSEIINDFRRTARLSMVPEQKEDKHKKKDSGISEGLK